ncbi:MAG: glycosyltransferase family 2 protein [Bdellovibrio sp.]
MKVSVCIVTYNQERYIRECLDSVVKQECTFPFEVIVADDCSTDKTGQIVREYALNYSCIKILRRDKNIGLYKNFIDVHNHAIGEYVCHLDGDDRWLPDKLQKQVDFLDRNLEFTAVWTKANYFDDHGNILLGENYHFPGVPNGVVELGQALRLGSFAVHSSIMYRATSRVTRDIDQKLLDLYYTWEYLSSGLGKILEEALTEYRIFSTGALTVSGNYIIRKLACEHATYYLHKDKAYKKDIFIFALFNFLFDLRMRNKTIGNFFKLMVRSCSYIEPIQLWNTYRILRLRPIQLKK